jgi:hypothetical protein
MCGVLWRLPSIPDHPDVLGPRRNTDDSERFLDQGRVGAVQGLQPRRNTDDSERFWYDGLPCAMLADRADVGKGLLSVTSRVVDGVRLMTLGKDRTDVKLWKVDPLHSSIPMRRPLCRNDAP